MLSTRQRIRGCVRTHVDVIRISFFIYSVIYSVKFKIYVNICIPLTLLWPIKNSPAELIKGNYMVLNDGDGGGAAAAAAAADEDNNVDAADADIDAVDGNAAAGADVAGDGAAADKNAAADSNAAAADGEGDAAYCDTVYGDLADGDTA